MQEDIKEAFLLSAGLGTRLKPYTDTLPKPLVPVCGKPLIQWNLELLHKLGCKKVVVNVHYRKDQLIQYLKSNPIDGMRFVISEEETLLDTGGGLKKALEYIDGERFFTWNSDVMLDPRVIREGGGGIRDLIEISLNGKSLISLFVKKLDESSLGKYSELLFDQNLQLCRFVEEDFTSGQVPLNELTKFVFLGISIMHRDISSHFPKDLDIFSLTKDIFPRVLRDHFKNDRGGIYGSSCNYYWNDVGNPSRLDEASKEIGKILPLL